MFVLDGKPLALDVPFSHNGVNYPANWLRLASPEEREAIGITEEPDPQPYDQRFYWGWNEDGKLIPKDHTELVTLWVGQTRTTAGTLLGPSDWLIIRELDNGTPTPDDWKVWRETVRQAAATKITTIEATTSTDELAQYITGADYSVWPLSPNTSAIPSPSSAEPPSGSTSAGAA